MEVGTVKVLVVGAGGIGCELLKTLVLSGFRKVSIIDLDSIDVSNLNRQFLFRKADVGKGKALVASQAIRRYCPNQKDLDIQIYTDRVQDLPREVFSNQDIIFDALDNFEARRYVNRMCVWLEKPLIESGSTGNNGQVFPTWSKAGTECFECRGQPTVKSFPVCTIRLTPERPEHCIAWARYLLEILFGPADENNVLTDWTSTLQSSTDGCESPASYAKALAKTLFVTNIEEYLNALKLEKVGGKTAAEEEGKTAAEEKGKTAAEEEGKTAAEGEGKTAAAEKGKTAAEEEGKTAAEEEGKVEGKTTDGERMEEVPAKEAEEGVKRVAPPRVLEEVSTFLADLNTELGTGEFTPSANDPSAQDIPNVEQCLRTFLDVVTQLKRNQVPDEYIKFDKDDPLTLAFVYSASNLRMTNYHIKRLSLWACKSIAGSIQPAIAATNAIVAGLQVEQALKLLKLMESGTPPTKKAIDDHGVRFVWVRSEPTGKHLLMPEVLDMPNKNCFICQEKKLVIKIGQYNTWTVRTLMENVLKQGLLFEGEITIQSTESVLVDSDLFEDDPELYDRSLQEAGLSLDDVVSVIVVGKITTSFDMILREDQQMEEQTFEIEKGNDVVNSRSVLTAKSATGSNPIVHSIGDLEDNKTAKRRHISTESTSEPKKKRLS